MNFYAKTILLSAALISITGCSSLYSTLGLVNKAKPTYVKPETKEETKKNNPYIFPLPEEEVQTNTHYIYPLERPSYQERHINELWKAIGLKRPRAGEYLDIPYNSFICTTQEDLDHILNIMINSSGRYKTMYIDDYSRSVVGTDCITFVYPYRAVGYISQESNYKGIPETKIFWKQEGWPFKTVSIGWVSRKLDTSINLW